MAESAAQTPEPAATVTTEWHATGHRLPTSPYEFEERHRLAELRLGRALNPGDQGEFRVVAWLQGWEAETMDTISAMIERQARERD